MRDYLVASLEFTIPRFAKAAPLYNAVMGWKWVRTQCERRLGLVDSPLISTMDLAAVLRQSQVRPADPAVLAGLSAQERQKSVILVQDSFTRFFETEQLSAFIALASQLGLHVWLAPLLPNGKPLQVLGFLRAFRKAAIRNAAVLQRLAAFDIPLVGLDPAMTLVYRQEYRKLDGIGEVPVVALPQEWLPAHLPPTVPSGESKMHYRLFSHCTEASNAPESGSQWVKIFRHCGLLLEVQATGCCGMSGTYGHEARNLPTSQRIYAQSWQEKIDAADSGEEVLATGYSCRSQVRRLSGKQLRHPLQVLAALFLDAATGGRK